MCILWFTEVFGRVADIPGFQEWSPSNGYRSRVDNCDLHYSFISLLMVGQLLLLLKTWIEGFVTYNSGFIISKQFSAKPCINYGTKLLFINENKKANFKINTCINETTNLDTHFYNTLIAFILKYEIMKWLQTGTRLLKDSVLHRNISRFGKFILLIVVKLSP